MGSEVLLNPADPAFNFHHAMAHRAYYQAMGPLSRWSVLPYLLDPPSDTARRASKWHLNHQQAHNDAIQALPSGWERPAVGIPSSQILVDSSLADPRSLTWWTFINHQEHYVADNALLPLPNTLNQDGTAASAPWWIPLPRWVRPPYW